LEQSVHEPEKKKRKREREKIDGQAATCSFEEARL